MKFPPLTDELRADADPEFARQLDAKRYAPDATGRMRCAAWIGEHRRCGRRFRSAWWHRVARWHRATLLWQDVLIVIKAVDNASYVLDRMSAELHKRLDLGARLALKPRPQSVEDRGVWNRALWVELRYAAGL